MELINDSRLTATMQRIRSGSKQMFREPSKDRSHINEQNADVVLQHKNVAMYAELIDGNWYWINGCGACKGEGRSFKTYIECDNHNVCRSCGKHRAEFKGTVWGGSNGWICIPCKDAEKKEMKKEALKKAKENKKDKYDFMFSSKPMCPNCHSELGSEIRGSEEVECDTCDAIVNVEVDWTPSYSTSLIKSATEL